MIDGGFIYYGEVCIDKDPQVKAIRTKDQGLLFKSLATDSSRMHMALADYLLQFRKPGDNPERVANTNESFPVQVWQQLVRVSRQSAWARSSVSI
jgi:hypothetical protein